LPSLRVIGALDQIIEWRGKPSIIRRNNVPEYVRQALADWTDNRVARLGFIQPGQPQQKAYVERNNRTVRCDWQAHYLFDSIQDVQVFATNWLWTYITNGRYSIVPLALIMRGLPVEMHPRLTHSWVSSKCKSTESR